MKRLFAILISSLIIVLSFAQNRTKTTYLSVVEELSRKLKLELSYSSDLVSLTDSTDFLFSSRADSCISELEKKAMLKITKTDTHLIVSSKVPAYVRLQGTVTDATTGELLPYANILIENAGTGTITNQNGQFDFKILGRYAGSKITFSFLGYKSEQVIMPFADNNALRVQLQSKPYTLSDIYILPKGTEAVDIVKRAVKNIKRNYARNTSQMEAFFRRTDYRDSVASQLIEAALLIQDYGIDQQASTTRIQLQEIRKSTNYLVKWDAKDRLFIAGLEKMFGHQNMFYRAYANYVRLYRSDWWFEPLTDYDTFKYEFAGFEWFDSVKVYKIRFIYDALWPDGRRASHNTNFEDGGCIYINSEDWAILKVEQWMKGLKGKASTLNGEYFEHSEMGYQKINGKYYLKYKQSLNAPNGKFWVYENPDAPDKHKKIKYMQWAETTLLITKVISDKKEMDKVRYREMLAHDEDSYKTTYPYHPEFWKNYTILKQKPMEEKFVKEMEWEKSLDIQFEENSSNHAENK